jgi:hypothetical protein
MLKTFTWNSYLMVVTTLTAVYYVVILIRYYKQGARLLAKRFWQRQFSSEKPTQRPIVDTGQSSGEVIQDASSGNTWEASLQVKQLTQHLKETIADAYQNHYNKEDLLLLLEMTLRDYLTLNGTPFQTMINELIESECSKYGFIHLSVVELEQIWKQDV